MMQIRRDEFVNRLFKATFPEYKSSYAGIKDYRLSMSGIGSERYNVAKQALIGKGLLSKSGAITIRGKNVLFSNEIRV